MIVLHRETVRLPIVGTRIWGSSIIGATMPQEPDTTLSIPARGDGLVWVENWVKWT